MVGLLIGPPHTSNKLSFTFRCVPKIDRVLFSPKADLQADLLILSYRSCSGAVDFNAVVLYRQYVYLAASDMPNL